MDLHLVLIDTKRYHLNSDNITLSIFRGTEEIQPTDENYY
jgi:hypothetical protein